MLQHAGAQYAQDPTPMALQYDRNSNFKKYIVQAAHPPLGSFCVWPRELALGLHALAKLFANGFHPIDITYIAHGILFNTKFLRFHVKRLQIEPPITAPFVTAVNKSTVHHK